MAERGAHVRIYEARGVGAGASGGLIGALSPHTPEKWNPKKAFQLRALLGADAYWAKIAAGSGLPVGYGRIGRVLPLASDAARALAHDRVAAADTLWQGRARWRIVEAVSGLAPNPHGFVHETLTARIFPQQAMAALARAAMGQGVEILENHPIADPQDLAADHVILAAGHHSFDLCPGLPAEFGRGVKGQSALLAADLDDMPAVLAGGLYVVPHGALGAAIGSTSEKTWDDPDRTDERLEALVAQARALVPALGSARVAARWAGIRPRARLPDPVLGQIPGADRLWLFSGGFKIGLGLAPLLAQALADLILTGDADLPESFTLAAQFSRGQ